MKPSFLTSFSKNSRIYTGNFPVVLDGAINCYRTSKMITQSFPNEIPPILGCTDPTAVNYNPLATQDDGSCIPCISQYLNGFRYEAQGSVAFQNLYGWDVINVGNETKILDLECDINNTYIVTIRFRGIVETTDLYYGGVQEGNFYTGGNVYGGNRNAYTIHISNPSTFYGLNAYTGDGPSGESVGNFLEKIDYTKNFVMNGNSQLVLTLDTGDGLSIGNNKGGTHIYVEGVSPYPDYFNGQFIQLDVLAVSLI